MGVAEHKERLISFINATVSLADQVVDVTLLNPYHPQNLSSAQLSILDMKAVRQTGQRHNIAIQITDETGHDKRALYDWAKRYIDPLQSAHSDNRLHTAIGIHILHFMSIPESSQYPNVWHVRQAASGRLYFTNLALHTIALVTFSKGRQAD